MILYWSIITIAIVILSVINVALGSNVWGLNEWWSIAILWGCVAYEFAIDGFFAWFLHELPDKWFTRDKKIFKVSKKSRKFYDAIKIKSWKDKVWELGGLGGFSKKNLEKPNNPEYIEKFIIECNKGVLTHRLSYPIGFLPMVFMPNVCAYSVALPVAMVNLFLNVLPTLVIRYNTPTLKSILKRMKRK